MQPLDRAEDPHTVSVITAALPRCRPWLTDTWASLRDQQLPDGWRLQWIVQEDGGAAELRSVLERLTDGSAMLDYQANGAAWGAATSRNLAASRATGAFLFALDGDDVLTPNALPVLLKELTEHPSAGWAAGRTVYLHEDGGSGAYPDRMPPGDVPAGWVGDDFLQHRRPAAHPGAVLHRTDLHAAAGGWMALNGSEDVGPFIEIAETFPGRAVDDVVFRYRKWGGSTTAADSWRADQPRQIAVIARRIAARRRVAAAAQRADGGSSPTGGRPLA